jgi:hypothetical protein
MLMFCQVSSPTDTSNFDVDDNDIRVSDAQPPSHNPGKIEMAALACIHYPLGVPAPEFLDPK